MEEEILKDVDVFNYHGWREQCKHIVSEIYELTDAIHDFELSNGQGTTIKSWNNMCEEIADVEFMLNQIKEKYLILSTNVDAWGNFKRKRESKRIKEGYYEKPKVEEAI